MMAQLRRLFRDAADRRFLAVPMKEIEQLKAQADRCRRLALGLSNRDDVHKLERLAAELEARAHGAMFGVEKMARPAGFEPAA